MRKIIQIATCGVENNAGTQCNMITIALCDDGTAWEIDDSDKTWRQMPEIPQPPAITDGNHVTPPDPVQVDWSRVPVGEDWVQTNRHGESFSFCLEPQMRGNDLIPGDCNDYFTYLTEGIITIATGTDWRETKRKRPGVGNG